MFGMIGRGAGCTMSSLFDVTRLVLCKVSMKCRASTFFFCV